MEYRLRGHHLLCLLGYRGMGYSEKYVQEMTKLHAALRGNSETRVTPVEGPDDLCCNFPADQPYHCEERTVHERDASVLVKLGLEADRTYTWRDIEARVAENVIPSDVPVLCSTCPWLSYGVCEEGVDRVIRGEGLVEVKG